MDSSLRNQTLFNFLKKKDQSTPKQFSVHAERKHHRTPLLACNENVSLIMLNYYKNFHFTNLLLCLFNIYIHYCYDCEICHLWALDLEFFIFKIITVSFGDFGRYVGFLFVFDNIHMPHADSHWSITQCKLKYNHVVFLFCCNSQLQHCRRG